MTKLKTLNDIGEEIKKEIGMKEPEIWHNLGTLRRVRKEAIKWVKSWCQCERCLCEKYKFMEFFNIKEEELK